MLNSTSAVILEDIVKGSFHYYPTERMSYFVVKGSILALGCLSMVLVLVVEHLGTVLMVDWTLEYKSQGNA